MKRKKFVFNWEFWEAGVFYHCRLQNGMLAADRQNEDMLFAKAVYFSAPLDSREKGTVWGRMKLNFETLEDSFLTISYFAADTKTVKLSGTEINVWDMLKNPEYQLADKLSLLEPYWIEVKKNTPDLLLSGAKGRYFWFKLEFHYFGGPPPYVKNLEIEFPIQSILEYLPEVYRENAETYDFSTRFLGIFQALLYDQQDKIDEISCLFDMDYTNGEFLLWLSEWVSADILPLADNEKLRQFLKISFQLYKEKGTKRGMERLLEFYTGKMPIILETWRVKEYFPPALYQRHYKRFYGEDRYSFFIFLEESLLEEEHIRRGAELLAERYKPAHTRAFVLPLKQCILLGQYTYLGINTRMGGDLGLQLEKNVILPLDSAILREGEAL